MYPTGGWSVYSKDDWNKQPTKPEMVEMRMYNGARSKVPIGDVQQHIGFEAIPPDFVPQEMADYAQKAFEKDSGQGKYYSFKGAGHIKQIRYNPTYQVMEVNFVKRDDIVTFFRVPKSLASEFEHLATSNSMMRGIDGTMRHGLGIRFWDEVRIRGQRTGSRYPFAYGAGNSFKGGSEQGKYAEMQLRTVGEREQQAMDAQREATIVNTEQPSMSDAAKTAAEEFKAILASNKYLPIQEKRINDARRVLFRKYGIASPAHREFTTAVERGWEAVRDVIKLYKLKEDVPKDALE
jgi:hypothetical protein